MPTANLTIKTRSCNRRNIPLDDDESQAYSYGGDYRYTNEYDDEAEEQKEEEEQQQRYAYKQYANEDDDEEYQNKLD